MDLFVGLEMVGGGTRFHGFCKNHVAVIVIYYQYVLVTSARWNDEATGGVGCYFTCDRFTGCKDVVGSYSRVWCFMECCAGGRVKTIGVYQCEFKCSCGELGRALVFTGLVEVAFVHGH